MKDAYILVDKPESCLKCKFLVVGRNTRNVSCGVSIFLNTKPESIKWIELDKIADWCPVKSLPDEKYDSHGYNAGWNDAIRLMTNKGEKL